MAAALMSTGEMLVALGAKLETVLAANKAGRKELAVTQNRAETAEVKQQPEPQGQPTVNKGQSSTTKPQR